MSSSSRFDSAYLVLYGYPILFVASFLLWPDITGLVWLTGCVIAIPLFFMQGRGGQAEGPSERIGFAWFRLVLAGVAFNWPFILATLADCWRSRRKRQEPER